MLSSLQSSFKGKNNCNKETASSATSGAASTTSTTSTNTISSQKKNTEDVDAMLVNELNELSFHDRNAIQEEVHGVRCIAPEEDPQQVQIAVDTLQQQIKTILLLNDTQGKINSITNPLNIKVDNKFRETILSNQQCQEYIFDNIDLRLKYLRADLMDVTKATKRMLKHLQLLHKYFGIAGIQRPIRYSDLTKQEQDLVKVGNIQILPSRDRSGRLVLVYQGSMPTEGIPAASRLRVIIYNICVLAEDVETQKLGYVSVCIPDREVLTNYKRILDPQEQIDWKDCFQCHPVRVAAMHLCHPSDPTFEIVKRIYVLVVAGKDQRIRTKFYSGLTTEILYQLLTYGIPVHELPITATGTIKTKNHLFWIKGRKAIDKAREIGADETARTKIFHPGVHDVLFSRGGNINHYGNIEFHQILSSKAPLYNSTADRKVRTKMRCEMIDLVKERKGRMLQLQGDGWWVEITDSRQLHQKLTNALYDVGRKTMARENCQNNDSDTSKFLESNKRQKVGQDDDDDGACGLLCK